MAKGFEGWVCLLPEDKGWKGTSTLIRGNFLFADEESLSINKNIIERPGKITHGRALKASGRVLGEQTPGGDVTFQFRSDDVPMVCAAHFQKFIGSALGGTATGTTLFTFVPEKGVPNFTGSAFGTGAYTAGKGDCYTVSVLKKFFDTTENGGTTAQWYKSCVVDELMFTMTAGDDAKCKAAFRAGNVDVGSVVGSLLNPNSSLGSYSTKESFEWWSATLSYGGGTLDVNKFEWSSKNNMDPFKVLGSQNPSRYRFGRNQVEGSFDLDMPYDGLKHFATMLGGSAFAVTATLYNGVHDYVTFNFPNCRLRPIEANLRGGDQETAFTLPFTAYEAENGSTAPVTVQVETTTWGSNLITRI